MRTAIINATGKTDYDIELALEEALKRIKSGNTSGFDENNSGSFDFEITGDEEESEEN